MVWSQLLTSDLFGMLLCKIKPRREYYLKEEIFADKRIYYGVHTPAIDSLILGARPQYAIINTPHGLWGEISGHGVFYEI